jgi:hypothetical protein
MLRRIRALLSMRRELLAASSDELEWIGSGSIVAYKRGSGLVALNPTPEPAVVEIPGMREIVFSTHDVHRQRDGDPAGRGALTLMSDEAILVQTDRARP